MSDTGKEKPRFGDALLQPGEEFLAALHSLVQTVKIHQENNQLVVNCIARFMKAVQILLEDADDLSVQVAKGRFYIQEEKLIHRRSISNMVDIVLKYFDQRGLMGFRIYPAVVLASAEEMVAFARYLNDSIKQKNPMDWLVLRFEEAKLQWIAILQPEVIESTDAAAGLGFSADGDGPGGEGPGGGGGVWRGTVVGGTGGGGGFVSETATGSGMGLGSGGEGQGLYGGGTGPDSGTGTGTGEGDDNGASASWGAGASAAGGAGASAAGGAGAGAAGGAGASAAGGAGAGAAGGAGAGAAGGAGAGAAGGAGAGAGIAGKGSGTGTGTGKGKGKGRGKGTGLGRRGDPGSDRGVAEVELPGQRSPRKVYAYALESMREVARKISVNQRAGVRNAVRMVQNMVEEVVLQEQPLLLAMSTIRVYDDYTFTHSVNVAILCMYVGKQIGVSKETMESLGISALFHDLGKVLIPQNILNKEKKLSSDEIVEIRKHSLNSIRLIVRLRASAKRKTRILLPPFEHHLRFDLNGYPKIGWKRPVSLCGRILTICDVYDALTSPRIYRPEAMSADRALGLMLEGSGTVFDPILLKVFINMLGVYPIGTLLELDNGDIGLVSKAPSTHVMNRPSVILLEPDGHGSFDKGMEVDLADKDDSGFFYRNVTGSIHPAVFNIQPAEFLTM